MKTLFFFADTETTGLLKHRDQNLSYAMVLCDGDETLIEKEVKIRIKDNIYPNPAALLVNNINPFDPAFVNESMSEYDAAHLLANTLLEYKSKGYRIVLIAYNAQFDVDMFEAMFNRCGINMDALISFTYDPLITAKALVADGTLKTREVQTGYGGKSYKSAKLEDVYNALGYSSDKITAHNALEDTKMLKTACMKLYLLFCGKTLDEAKVDLSTFTEKEVKTIVYSDKLDLKIKTVMILRSAKPENMKLETGFFALDYDLVSANPGEIKSNIIHLDPKLIFDEIDLRSNQYTKLQNFFSQNPSAIMEAANKLNFPKMDLSTGITHEVLSFGQVENTADKKIKDPSAVLTEQEQAVEALAEEYAYARFNKGWTSTLKGKNHENESKKITIDDETVVELNTTGIYYVRINDVAVLGSEKKSEVLEYLSTNGKIESGTELYKKLSSFLVPAKSFKNSKHPNFLIKEFNDKKTEVFNGANKLHKETLKNLLEHYKKLNPEPFKDLTTPEFKLNLNIFKKN